MTAPARRWAAPAAAAFAAAAAVFLASYPGAAVEPAYPDQRAVFPRMWDGANWIVARGDATNGLKVQALASALPTGAATAANQTTANTSLSSIDGKLAANASTTLLASAARTATVVGPGGFT